MIKLEAKQRLLAAMPLRDVWQALLDVRSEERSYQANGFYWYAVYLPDAKKKVRRMKDADFKAALEALEKTHKTYAPQENDPEYFGFIGLTR
jgi:hypothetical protein